MVSCVAGLRWVCYVRVVRGAGSVSYQAVGVGHRGPRTVALSARRAAALAGSVPFVEVSRRADPAAAPLPAR